MTTIAAIHVGRRELGLDDDTARDIYEQATGKRSLRAMSEDERKKVLLAFNNKGFKRASTGCRKGLKGPYAKKLQALWIAGWNLGLVRNRDDKALLAFVKRQTGLEHTQFLHDAANAKKVIEALKGWLAREGGVDWNETKNRLDLDRKVGWKIATAQAAILQPDLDVVRVQLHLLYEVHDLTGQQALEALTDADWIPVMNALGKQVRAKQGRG